MRGAYVSPGRLRGGLSDTHEVHALVVLIAAATLVPQQVTATRFGRLVQRADPVYCAFPRGRSFALTIDDGPSPYTARLARVLRRGHARATFFVVGSRVSLFPDGARAAARVGVFGNHTWSHARLLGLSLAGARQELVETQRAVGRVVGSAPRLFRPPFNEADPELDLLARELNLLDIRWSVDGGDTRLGTTPAAVVRTVRPGLRPGAIVLVHDLHPWTPAVVRRILRIAHRRGLRSVTIPELLRRQPPSLGQLGSQGAARCPA
jgi:peptidoglycan/xylan/chitin deacetylase (PgdA/CDA1 family)